MPLNIYDLTSDRKTMQIAFTSGELTLTYRPNSLTPARELASLRRSDMAGQDDEQTDEDFDAARAERNIRRHIQTIVELVEAWDFEGPLVVDEFGEQVNLPREAMHADEGLAAWCEARNYRLMVPEGQVVPIEYDYLVPLPTNFLLTIVEKINQDMRPDPKRRRR